MRELQVFDPQQLQDAMQRLIALINQVARLARPLQLSFRMAIFPAARRL